VNTLEIEESLSTALGNVSIVFIALAALWYGIHLYNKGKMDAVLSLVKGEIDNG
jgi:hypothetical protein